MAIFTSWVTTIIVLPSLFKSLNNLIICSPVFESRFPVGSSARITSGLFARALAIATLCLKAGLNREKLSKEYKTDFARPFDSKKRYIEAAFAKEGEKWHVLVGAPEFLSKKLKIDHDLEKDYHKFAQKGLRVVGLAVFGPKKKLFGHALLTIEEETRKSVPSSVEEAKRVGFRVVMMTGDYAETAKAIAKKVGIYET